MSSIVEEKRQIIPTFIKYLLACIVGTALFGLPALLIVLLHNPEEFWPLATNEHFKPMLGELFRWSLLLSGTYFAYMTALIFVALVPFIIRMARLILRRSILGIRGKDSLRHILLIRHYFALPIAAFTLWFLVTILIGTVDPKTTLIATSWHAGFYTVRGSFAFFLFASLLLVEKLIVQRIAINYHYEYYADRIEENKFALKAIKQLSKHLPPPQKVHFAPKRLSLSQDPMLQEMEVEDTTEMTTTIFKGLQSPGNDYLLPEDFEKVLPPQDAARLFSLLDRDANNDLTLRDMLYGVQHIYEEHCLLDQALVSNDDLIRRLDMLGLVLVILVVIVLCLPIFDVSLAGSVVGIGAAIMSYNALFKGSLASMFQIIVFIFISHPFDVGDSILLRGKKYRVKTIGWWNSSFYGDGSRLIYMPNAKLVEIPVSNLRRSGNQSEEVEFQVELGTTRDQLIELEKKLNDFLLKNTRDYDGPTMVEITKLIDSEKMTIIMQVKHRSNFQLTEVRNQRRLKFMHFVRQTLVDCRIRLG